MHLGLMTGYGALVGAAISVSFEHRPLALLVGLVCSAAAIERTYSMATR